MRRRRRSEGQRMPKRMTWTRRMLARRRGPPPLRPPSLLRCDRHHLRRCRAQMAARHRAHLQWQLRLPALRPPLLRPTVRSTSPTFAGSSRAACHPPLSGRLRVAASLQRATAAAPGAAAPMWAPRPRPFRRTLPRCSQTGCLCAREVRQQREQPSALRPSVLFSAPMRRRAAMAVARSCTTAATMRTRIRRPWPLVPPRAQDRGRPRAAALPTMLTSRYTAAAREEGGSFPCLTLCHRRFRAGRRSGGGSMLPAPAHARRRLCAS